MEGCLSKLRILSKMRRSEIYLYNDFNATTGGGGG